MFDSQQKCGAWLNGRLFPVPNFGIGMGTKEKLRNIVIDYGVKFRLRRDRLKFLWFVFTAA